MRKPFTAFYQLLLDRYGVNINEALFIDDNLRNIHAAREMGLPAIHFSSPEKLKEQLEEYGIMI